jgi:LysM repeat protein
MGKRRFVIIPAWIVLAGLLLVLGACNLFTSTESAVTPQVVFVTPTARNLSCEQIIDDALTQVGAACATLGRNQACYGNPLLNVELQPAQTATFDLRGDIADLNVLQRITASPLDDMSDTWGVVLLQAQANLPGQNATFVLFGDTALDDVSPAMNAVTLSTGVGRSTCADAPPDALLLQSPDGVEVTVTINGATITLGSTLYITAVANGEMRVATLEGTGVVAAQNVVRVVQAGAQVRLPLGGSNGLTVTGAPSALEAFDTTDIVRAPLTLLPRAITLPAPAAGLPAAPGRTPAGSTLQPTSTTGASSTACTPRTDWSDTYNVQAGDTLSRIARRYNISLSDLQTGNCITNPNLITVGQALRVPPLPAASAPQQGQPSASVQFTADETLVNAGQCTTVRWSVMGASGVYFEDVETTPQNSQEVCPTQTTRYTLLIVSTDGTQTPYTLSIEVAAPECGNQVCEFGENANLCQRDCPASCGNGTCDRSESSNTCPVDCRP